MGPSRILLFSLVAITAWSCAPRKSVRADQRARTTAIINGAAVTTDEQLARSVVALQINGKSEEENEFCTGTLISPRVILTAAHCFKDKTQNGFAVFATSVNGGVDAERVRKFSDVVIHSGFVKASRLQGTPPAKWTAADVKELETNGWFDIALIQLEQAAPSDAKPLAIASQIPKDPNLVVAGFGVTDRKDMLSSGELHRGTLQIKNSKYSLSEILLASKNASVCHGDSGGPALVANGTALEVVGILSHDELEACNGPAVFTSVPPFNRWIQNRLELLK